MKNEKILILALSLITVSCNSSNLPVGNDTKNVSVKTNIKAIESPTLQTSSSIETNLLNFETFPETSENASLEDKYNLQEYIDKNKVLGDIPYSSVDNYKVRFTSDGGAVFSVKAEPENPEYVWKRTPQKLLFDNFQLVNIIQEKANTKYYSRYSQLIENDITVNNTQQNFSKKANLVQTVGLSLTKDNQSYKIANFTPIIIRQVEKNSLPYKIDRLSLQSEKTAELNIDGEKTLIPWPGISFNNYITQKKLKITVLISSDKTEKRNLAMIVSLQGSQYQINQVSENSFSTEFELPALKAGKNSLIIELIDQKSLEENSKYQGYTWVVPFIITQ